MKEKLITLLIVALAPYSLFAQKVDYVEPQKPYSNSPFLQKATKKSVSSSSPLLVPMITWAPDGVTVHANAGTKPNPNSSLARAIGRPVELKLIDDFDKQVENYVTGKSAFLRGTADMIALVADALKQKDPGLEPIVFLQLSTSTGADGFVGKDIDKLKDLKGKTIVAQLNGPHLSLIGNMLSDAGLSSKDVTIKFVPEITTPPNWSPGQAALDPANAFRNDESLSGAACIYPDILALTAGGTVGTGLEGTVKGAKPLFTTKTASNVIFDVYAVRKDFLDNNKELVEAFRSEHLKQQEFFLKELANIAKKSQADKSRVSSFKKLSKPLAGIFLQDESAVSDFILWVGVDAQLAGVTGNERFFDTKNPVSFTATTNRIQDFFLDLGLIGNKSILSYHLPSKETAVASTELAKPKQAFASTQAVRQAAESAGANTLYTYTFTFPAQIAEIDWRDYAQVFATIHETVSRYGGAIVQLRGHADNFFYNFVRAKMKQNQSTYERRIPGTDQFQKLPLPKIEQILNDAQTLSYARAFSVKKAYAAYVRENLNLSPEEVDLSRFDVKGMSVKDPLITSPKTPQERAQNMRGEMFIISAESEIPAEFGADDLR
ncbi:MAG: ABC transporter substrate-binding protein [Verrucomicrobiota bacterium]